MRWLALALLAACSGLHDPWPGFPGSGSGSGGFPPIPDDPRLGTLIHTGGGLPGGLFADAQYATDGLYVAIGELHEGDAKQLFVYAVHDTPTLLPTPPLIAYPLKLAFAAGPGVLVLGENGAEYWDGTAWSVIPDPPITNYANARWIVRGANQMIVGPDATSTIYFWNGTTWRALANGVNAFGPWDDAGLRVLSGQGTMCTTLYALPSGSAGSESCATDPGQAFWDELGGSTSDFTELADSYQLFHFTGAWSAGDFGPINARVAPYPGVSGVLQTGGDLNTSPSYDELATGAVGRNLVPPLVQQLGCTCDRGTDLSCPCEPGRIGWLLALSPDRTRAAFVTQRSIDGTDKIYVRFDSVPVTDMPFSEPYP